MSKHSIGLIIVGDEILSGRRQDKHFATVLEMLSKRNLQLSWVNVLSDDMDVLVRAYKQSFATGDIVFSCGGIGATPDDKTREAVAKALDVSLALHPEAEQLITARFTELQKEGQGAIDMTTPENQRRLQMGVFPVGSEIVPNPYNKIPGFYIQNHTFVPGFPEMAWPMIEWTLDNRYKDLQNQAKRQELSFRAYAIVESRITSALEAIESKWPEVKTFSLPSVAKEGADPFIELGVKGQDIYVQEAFDYLKAEVLRLGGHFTPN